MSSSAAFVAAPFGTSLSPFVHPHPHRAPFLLPCAHPLSHPCASPARHRTARLVRSQAATPDAQPKAPTTFTWCVGTSRQPQITDALLDAARQAASSLSRQQVRASLVVVFVKSSFQTTARNEMRRVIPTLRKSLALLHVMADDTVFYGSSTATLSGHADDATVSLALAHFPSPSSLHTVRLDDASFSLDWDQRQWHDAIGLSQDVVDATGRPLHRYLFSLYHPDFAEHMGEVLSGLDFAYPGVRKLGAEAGLANPLHDAVLFDNDGVVSSGAMLLAIVSPHVQVDVSVAQGARGVGPLMEVAGVLDGTEISAVRELGTSGASSGPPLVLLDMWVKTDIISLEDSRLVAKYLLFGTEVSDGASMSSLAAEAAAIVGNQTNGDGEGADNNKEGAKDVDRNKPIVMLSRKVTGFNETTKSLGVEGGAIRLGTRARFQIRDEEGARAELTALFDRLVLEASSKAMDGMALMGGLVFVDGERGAALHGNVTPDLDCEMFKERFAVPVALMTSGGQIGPLPSGGLLGFAGDTFMLSASALYVSFYGSVGKVVDGDE